MLEEAGCDLLWLPSASDIYPAGFATQVRVSGLSDHWEGAVRPGHFEGVATVVAKLLLSVGPDIAVFGEKDFQQLAVIRRLVRDLNIATEIVGVPTVRDPDGLALSSRNAYLSEAERRQALALPRALEAARAALLSGSAVAEVLEEARNSLLDGGFSQVDYFALVDPETLAPIDAPKDGMRLIAAAAIGIDAADRQPRRSEHGFSALTISLGFADELSPHTKDREGEIMGAISQKSAEFLIRSRLADAERGDVDALFELGVAFSTGRGGVDVDLIEAHKWFNLAALSG